MKIERYLGLAVFLLLSMPVMAKIKYAASSSKVSVSGKAKLSAAKKLTVTTGTLEQAKNATLEGTNYTFNNGNINVGTGAQSNITGAYSPPAQTFSYTNNSLKVTGGTLNQTVNAAGISTLEGFGTFNAANTIILGGASSVLNVAISSPIATNIELNGGTINALGNICFANGTSFVGDGSVNFNGFIVSFDALERIFSDKLDFVSASDLNFSGKIILDTDAVWTFSNDSFLSGNGNILDISDGGIIRIRRNTTLGLSNLKLRGLGTGSIVFDDPTAHLLLSSVEIEMNDNYTVTIGGIYAEGPTRIVTKNNTLTFDVAGTLTVDGIALEYDPLGYFDTQNIQPLAGNDVDSVHITLLNDGIIRSRTNFIGDIHFIVDSFLFSLLPVGPAQRLFFDESVTLDGQTNVVFMSNAQEPLIIVADGKTAHVTNIVLQNLSPDFIALGDGSALIFDDATKIDFAKNEELNTTWTFNGNCVINGHNHILYLGEFGEIIIKSPGASLMLDNIILIGASANKIRCFDNSSTVSLKNVTWHLDDDYSFTNGRFDVLGTVKLAGAGTFAYQTNRESKIASGAQLTLEQGALLSYAPISDNRDLLAMEDATSFLFLNGATLASTTTGLRLTKGHLVADSKNYIENAGAVSVSEGVCFGDGNVDDDLALDLLPGCNINLLSGQLVYANVN